MAEGAGNLTLLLLVDASGAVRHAEGRASASLDGHGEPIVGRPLADACPDQPELIAGVRRALAGASGSAVLELGGQPTELRFDTRRGTDDAVVGALVIGEAVDEVAATSALDRPALRRLFRQLPCVAWATDRDLQVTEVVGRLPGFPPSVIGRRIDDVLGVGDDDPLIAACRQAIAGSSSAQRYSFGGRDYEVHVEPLRDDSDGIVGCSGVGLDVSARIEAEQSLRRSEERLARAQQIAHVGSWDWDVGTNRVHWSDELYRIYGLAKGTFAGTYEAFMERVLPDDREHTRSVVFDAFRKVQPFVYDHRIVRADGQVRMLHTRGDVTADANGKVTAMAGSCWDTTELWEATRARDYSISLLRATLESTADGLLVVDNARKISAYNQQLLKLWNLPRQMVEHNDFESLLTTVHDQLENGEACMQRVRQLEAQPELESFDSLRFRDGRFYERYSRPQRIGDEIVGRVWSYRDVTERERLLRSAVFLADASRLLASLDEEEALEAMARLALTYVGDACAVDLYTGAEPRRLLVLSRSGKQLLPAEPPPGARPRNASIYTVGNTSYMTVPLWGRGELLGALTFAAESERRYSDADLTLAADLGSRVELALENARLYRKAREALSARDQFLSVAAHEIRSPLTSLHLAVQGLQQGPPPPLQSQLLAIIEREDQRIARLVDELLDVARIRAGQLHFVFAPVDLVDVTREVATRLKAELTRSGSPLSITAPGAVVGMWDRARLVQLVTNLLSNAIKFGLGKPIHISLESDGTMARLVVQDHGMGIAAEAQKRIFAPFERAVSDRHYGGLGLGLYIVRTVLEGLNGTVRVESQPGSPTTFTVELPLGNKS